MSRASKASLVVTLIFAVLTAISLFTVEPEPDPFFAGLPVFDLQGHRGARGLYPENTLAGFRGALALGVTTLEMDLVMTGDGEIVVHHDLHLLPTRTRGPDGAWLEEPGPAVIGLDLAALVALLQVVLGIATLLLVVPLVLAVLHQAGAFLLLTALLWAHAQLPRP